MSRSTATPCPAPPASPSDYRPKWGSYRKVDTAYGSADFVEHQNVTANRVDGSATPTPTPRSTPTPTPTPTPTATSTPTATPTPGGGLSGYYKIIARHSGKAVVVQGASTADSANVIQWTYGGSATNDEWELRGIGSGYYRIINRNSGKDMVVQGASTSNGANVFQYSYGGTATNDEWQPVDLGNGYFRIVNRNSGKVLDVSGAGTADGTNVDQWGWVTVNQEMFQVVSVP